MSTHFASHVFRVHSAYSLAAGSSFARIPTRCGVSFNLEMLSRTSKSRDVAIVPARMVLQAVGAKGSMVDILIMRWEEG